jgi:LacI family transcriptional regulator
MEREPRRVALMLDLQWPYKRHSEIFAGVQRYAEELGWVSITDEFAHDSFRRKQGQADRYDGIVARASRQLARRAVKLGVPVVNGSPSSPVRHEMKSWPQGSDHCRDGRDANSPRTSKPGSCVTC